LRRNAGNQTRLRIGQNIKTRLAKKLKRLADRGKIFISADGGKLCNAPSEWVGTKGFVVVPEDAVQNELLLSRAYAKMDLAPSPRWGEGWGERVQPSIKQRLM
jgi:hypothetical protein